VGQSSHFKIITLSCCFLVTGALAYWGGESLTTHKSATLNQALADVKGWKSAGPVPLDAKVVSSLELDDYFNQYLTNGKDRVTLYIGYYHTSKKVGAAHSPLVCFPGQGWLLQDFVLRSESIEGHPVNLMHMVASTPQNKELLIFWFQAFDRTSPSEFTQKLNTLWSKFVNRRVDNAFVRVTVSMDKRTAEEAYEIGLPFIKAFYPRFLAHVQENAT
jgi:EpsI family protein